MLSSSLLELPSIPILLAVLGLFILTWNGARIFEDDESFVGRSYEKEKTVSERKNVGFLCIVLCVSIQRAEDVRIWSEFVYKGELDKDGGERKRSCECK